MMNFKKLICCVFLFVFAFSASVYAEDIAHYVFSDKSQIGFDGRSLMHGFKGKVLNLKGNFDVKWGVVPNLEKGELKIDTASLNTGSNLRDRKMKAEHLETNRFPLIKFKATQCTPINSESKDKPVEYYSLKGNLKLHGINREIILPVKVESLDKKEIVLSGETYLYLSDYKIPIPSAMGFIKMDEEVKVYFHIVANALEEEG